ncbi:MAG: mobile mystery protein B [Gemmatimonadota bacterium]
MQSSEPGGATPLDPDEADGLLYAHVGTRGELNELEEANIQMGLEWAMRRAVTGRRQIDVLTEDFLYQLHQQMFGEVWAWAGEVRRSNKNIGVDRHTVRIEVRNLIEDARVWREQKVYDPDELAVRFHHRLVAIHPFANGNGRHARLLADLIALQAGRPTFTWGDARLGSTLELRTAYISALSAADRGDMAPLIAFARS